MAYGVNYVNPAMVGEWMDVFKHQLSHCRLRGDETVLAVTDTAFHPFYAASCMGAAAQMGAEVAQVVLAQQTAPSEELLDSLFAAADLIVYSTTHTLHYSPAMRRALDRGARALMAVVPYHILQRRCADPVLIERTKTGAQLLDRTDRIRITSEAGTDLTMSKGSRPGFGSYGVADEPGHLDFWGGRLLPDLVDGRHDRGKTCTGRRRLGFPPWTVCGSPGDPGIPERAHCLHRRRRGGTHDRPSALVHWRG